MDPITALGVATTAFNTIKKGFDLGRDAESMMSDVGKWMSAIESVRNPKTKKVKKVANVEQEALDQFSAKKKADAMEKELKNYILATFGMKAWDELLRIQGQIRKRRKLEQQYEQKQREDMINAIIVGVGVLVGGGLLLFVMTFYI
mgnify:CR=1 FL=1